MSTYSHCFTNRSMFGLDIDHAGSLTVVQLERHSKQPCIVGYGSTQFDPAAIREGIIVDHAAIARAAYNLFRYELTGSITTKHVVISVPTCTTFTRFIRLPRLKAEQVRAAVVLEIRRNIPIPLAELYVDYKVLNQDKRPRRPKENIINTLDICITAVHRPVVDSQRQFLRILGLEMVSIETTTQTTGKLFLQDRHSDIPALLVEVGSASTDISILDQDIITTKTIVGCGSEAFTRGVRDKLGVTEIEAQIIKTRYGLGPSKKQAIIRSALEPVLGKLDAEIQHMSRSYDDAHGGDRKISQIILLGSGADMPGLSEYMTDNLRLAARSLEPWSYFNYSGLRAPAITDKPMFAVAMGLSLMPLRTLFKRQLISGI